MAASPHQVRTSPQHSGPGVDVGGFERQTARRREYRRRRPQWTDSVTLFRHAIAQRARAGQRVLDLGCGKLGLHGDDLTCAGGAGVVGVDPDHRALAANSVLAVRVAASGEALPFAARSFDVVASAWVLEHLEHPGLVLSEVHRVLKPGGHFVFLTPNAWNYNAWLIRAVPNRFHSWFTQRLYGRAPGDAYPVRYRANSPRVLARRLAAAGFDEVDLAFNGDPSYIAFNRPLFRLAVGLERLMDRPRLRRTRVHVVGVARR